jgi:hypothetical protein
MSKWLRPPNGWREWMQLLCPVFPPAITLIVLIVGVIIALIIECFFIHHFFEMNCLLDNCVQVVVP